MNYARLFLVYLEHHAVASVLKMTVDPFCETEP
jgi:hypothetical protein